MAALRLERLHTRQLAPFDLLIEAGALLLLSGASGSGKSQLLRAIADLDPHDGEVWLDDTPRSRTPPALWRRRVGLLPAESFWWDDLVGAHLQPLGATPSRIIDWLDRVGFEPDVLGWSVARLSSGERQRLALVRLLAQMPEALLLDEPTANLDPSNGARVEALVADYRQWSAAAVIWVSHDPVQRERLGGWALCIRDGRLESVA